jgi:hypothetical protein
VPFQSARYQMALTVIPLKADAHLLQSLSFVDIEDILLVGTVDPRAIGSYRWIPANNTCIRWLSVHQEIEIRGSPGVVNDDTNGDKTALR